MSTSTAELSGQSQPVAGSFEASDRHLRKAMGFTPLLFMSMGAIIGSGWLFGSLDASSVAGPASVLSWAIGGIFIIFIALSYAEIAGMLPRTGSIVRYPQLTHGAFTGWILGWTYWISAISVPAIEAEAVVTYVGGQFPSVGFVRTSHGVPVLSGWGIGFAVGLMALFFCLNFFGARILAETNRWFTWWKILIPTATFCMLFVAFRGSNFTAYKGGFFALGTSNIFVAMSTTGVIFAYLGFRQALDYAGEAKNPQRDVPLATILGVVIGIIIYALLQVGFVGALNWHLAGVSVGNWAGLPSSKWASQPLYDALRAAGIGALLTFSNFLLVDAGISPSGTGWIYLGTSARTTYGLGVNGYGPQALKWYNRWGIPWIPTIIAFVIGCLFFIPTPSWYRLVSFITGATALTYIMGGLGLAVLRRHAPDLPRPYRLGAAWFWAPIGFLAAALLVFWSTFAPLTNIYAAAFVGLCLFAFYYVSNKGWAKAVPSYTLGIVFLAAWIYISLRSGWVLRVNPVDPAHHGFWSFPIYDIAMSADVLFFCVGLWAISNAEGRRHVRNTAWLIWLLLATFPVEYYTAAVGPLSHAPLEFRWGTLIAVGIGLVAYFWGVNSGFLTDELQDILKAAGRSPDTGARLGNSPAAAPAGGSSPAVASPSSPAGGGPQPGGSFASGPAPGEAGPAPA